MKSFVHFTSTKSCRKMDIKCLERCIFTKMIMPSSIYFCSAAFTLFKFVPCHEPLMLLTITPGLLPQPRLDRALGRPLGLIVVCRVLGVRPCCSTLSTSTMVFYPGSSLGGRRTSACRSTPARTTAQAEALEKKRMMNEILVYCV